jgi:hypothetical protein
MKVENFSDVGRSDKFGFKRDNKFLHKNPRHEGEWNRGQGSPTKDKCEPWIIAQQIVKL